MAHEVDISYPEPAQLGRAQAAQRQQPYCRLVGITHVRDQLDHLGHVEDVAFLQNATPDRDPVPDRRVSGEAICLNSQLEHHRQHREAPLHHLWRQASPVAVGDEQFDSRVVDRTQLAAGEVRKDMAIEEASVPAPGRRPQTNSRPPPKFGPFFEVRPCSRWIYERATRQVTAEARKEATRLLEAVERDLSCTTVRVAVASSIATASLLLDAAHRKPPRQPEPRAGFAA